MTIQNNIRSIILNIEILLNLFNKIMISEFVDIFEFYDCLMNEKTFVYHFEFYISNYYYKKK